MEKRVFIFNSVGNIVEVKDQRLKNRFILKNGVYDCIVENGIIRMPKICKIKSINDFINAKAIVESDIDEKLIEKILYKWESKLTKIRDISNLKSIENFDGWNVDNSLCGTAHINLSYIHQYKLL